ncbi:MAG: hypothetical protein NTX27_04980 [Verrucomicrobia bacterium]|nr:hypothetical protein [Verrucomicrobiota bacterium]
MNYSPLLPIFLAFPFAASGGVFVYTNGVPPPCPPSASFMTDLSPPATAALTNAVRPPASTTIGSGIKGGAGPAARTCVTQPATAQFLTATGPLLNIDLGGDTGKTGPAAIGQTANDVWNTYNLPGESFGTLSSLVWSDGSPCPATLTVDNAPGVWGFETSDQMYQSYLYPWEGGSILLNISALPPGTCDIYVYGHQGCNSGNGVFALWSGGNAYGQRGTSIWGPGWNLPEWEEGQQYVVYRNVNVTSGVPVVLEVQPDFLGYAIVNGLQVVPKQVVHESAPALQALLNINFGSLTKLGFAAVGQTATDYWNQYNFPNLLSAAVPNLLWADQSSSGAGVVVVNGPGLWGNSTGDPMFDQYIYPFNWGHLTVTLTNLPEGFYDFHLYGHGPGDDANSIFQLTSGPNSHGPRGTSIWGTGWNSVNWEEGQQYVVFRNVEVLSGQAVILDVIPDAAGYAMINGLQIALPDDRDQDGLPDWWERWHFDSLAATPEGDFDADGSSNLQEYEDHTDPNTITFDVRIPAVQVSSNNIALWPDVVHGQPAWMAVLVDNTNLAQAVWVPYAPEVWAQLGSADGWHVARVGLRGRAADSVSNWVSKRVKLDRTPPLVVITSPTSSLTSQPILQITGYSVEPVVRIRYDLANAAGSLTDQEGYVSQQMYNPAARELGTNHFQCYDLELTNGPNNIALRLTDRAGNTATVNFSVTLDYAGDTTPPVLTLHWPPPGGLISGDSFTCRGAVDDPTAQIKAWVVSAAGETNSSSAVVERNGWFWVEDLPLAAGTSQLWLEVVDAAGNTSTMNVSVVKAGVALTIGDLSGEDLTQSHIAVSGTIGQAGYAVWVNGIKATTGSGNWSVASVPLNAGGTAVIQARAIPNSDNGGNGTGGGGPPSHQSLGNPASAQSVSTELTKDVSPRYPYVSTHNRNHSSVVTTPAPERWDSPLATTITQSWADGVAGGLVEVQTFGSRMQNDVCTALSAWPASDWPTLVEGTRTVACLVGAGSSSQVEGRPQIPLEHLDYCDLHYFPPDRAPAEGAVCAENAQAEMKMKTGGKGRAGTRNLFSVSGGATRIKYEIWRPWLEPEPDGYVVPPEEVRLGSLGKLGSDGYLYKALPDGITVDVTPFVDVPNYTFGVSAQKHGFIHTCVATTPPNLDRTYLGVGEQVNIYFDPAPPIAAQWATTAGSITSDSGPGTLLTAPSNSSSFSVTAEIRGAQFRLLFAALEPSGYDHAQIVSKREYGVGLVAAQMSLRVFFGPRTVSFYRVEIEEVGLDAINVWGCFTNRSTKDLHHSSDVFVGLNDDNSWKGLDECEGGSSTFPGGFTWPIPARWRIPGGEVHPMSGWSQVMSVGEVGTFRIEKFGRWVQRSTNNVILNN